MGRRPEDSCWAGQILFAWNLNIDQKDTRLEMVAAEKPVLLNNLPFDSICYPSSL